MSISVVRHEVWLPVALTARACIAPHEASAQICRPEAERTGELGCWIKIDAELGKLPQGAVF